VHSHWSIARLLREHPDAEWAARAASCLDRSLAPHNIEREVDYVSAPGRGGFEMPYGIAWLLLLSAELALHDTHWLNTLAPLSSLAETRFATWLERLPWPIRTGQHPQSAFAVGLAFDYAVALERNELADSIRARSRVLYGDDIDGPIRYEPSAYDFLSPCLAEADLMARVMTWDEFETWFGSFLPMVDLDPVTTPDRSDGKLVHLDGLNLSRAWMLDRIAAILGREDLADLARVHREAGMTGVFGAGYEGAHWLGTFALMANLAAPT
jgi:hypothetical protein